MELTQDFEIGIIQRVQRDRTFADALLDEVELCLRENENGTAQEILRVLVMGTVGFEKLSHELTTTSHLLELELSSESDPHAARLNAILATFKRVRCC